MGRNEVIKAKRKKAACMTQKLNLFGFRPAPAVTQTDATNLNHGKKL